MNLELKIGRSARRKQAPKDLTGIRQRGGRYQIRLFGGQDPVTGKQVMLTGSAEDEDAAIKLRDKFRRQVAEATAARTSVTLGYLLDQWLADHQVEETTRTSYRVAIDKFIKPAVGDTSLTRLAQLGARPFEQLYAELRVCRRRCKGRTFIEHRTHREHKCDKRCAPPTRALRTRLGYRPTASAPGDLHRTRPRHLTETAHVGKSRLLPAYATDPFGLLVVTEFVSGGFGGEVGA